MKTAGVCLHSQLSKERIQKIFTMSVRDVQFNKLPKKAGFDFAQPSSLVERSRWHSLSVKRKPNPTDLGFYFHASPLVVMEVIVIRSSQSSLAFPIHPILRLQENLVQASFRRSRFWLIIVFPTD